MHEQLARQSCQPETHLHESRYQMQNGSYLGSSFLYSAGEGHHVAHVPSLPAPSPAATANPSRQHLPSVGVVGLGIVLEGFAWNV